MTDAELLATGGLCQALLVDQNFKTVITAFELSLAADMLATKADDGKKREQLYSSLWGARELLAFMQLNAEAAATIKADKPPPIEGTTDYHVEPLADSGYDDEGFPRANNNENDY